MRASFLEAIPIAILSGLLLLLSNAPNLWWLVARHWKL
jgi:cellobiose-specific phosphotransferase system component IIC